MPHYQLPAANVPGYLDAIAAYPEKTISVKLYDQTSRNYQGSFINVFHQPTPSMENVMGDIDFRAIGELILQKGTSDGSRRNKYIDVGFASDLCTARSKESFGIAKPRRLTNSTAPLLVEAMVALSKLLPKACQPDLRKSAHRDPEREADFSSRLSPGNLFEGGRFGLTDPSHVLAIHEDSHNETSATHSGVLVVSKWVYLSDKAWHRVSCLGFSRKSVTSYETRKKLYLPVIKEIIGFYEALPQERVKISPSLLGTPKDGGPVRYIKPHSNKCVYYSVYAYCMEKLTIRLKLTKWHLLALCANVINSETPLFFWDATHQILEAARRCQTQAELNALFPLKDPVKFGLYVYAKIWELKESRSSCGRKKPVAGQRHQPHYNKRQEDWKVGLGLKNLFQLYLTVDATVDSRMAQDCHYYCLAVGRLVQTVEHGGVFGAGPLTAQHLLGVGSMVGLFPLAFLDHAQVGATTKTYSYLRDEYGFSREMEDTRQLMEALSIMLGVSFFVVENIICKWTQEKRGVAEKYHDSIYRVQFILYKLGMDLVKVTKKGQEVVMHPLCHFCRKSKLLDRNNATDHGGVSRALPLSCKLKVRHIIFPSKSATKVYVANKKKGSIKPGGSAKKRRKDTLSETARIGHHHLLSGAESEESGDQSEDDRNTKERDERREMPPSFSITRFKTSARVAFDPRRLSMEALGATVKKNMVKFVEFRLCGYTFLRAGLLLDNGEYWYPPRKSTCCFFPTTDSIVWDEHRFFYRRQSAQRFTMFAAIFEHDETYLRRVLVPRFLPKQEASESDEEMCGGRARGIRRLAVAYDPEGMPVKDRKSRPPYIGFFEYGDGVVGVVLLAKDGTRCEETSMRFSS